MHDRFNAVGGALRVEVELWSQQIAVAVPASDTQRWARDLHPRTDYIPRLDRIAQCDVCVAFSPNIPYRGKSRQQS